MIREITFIAAVVVQRRRRNLGEALHGTRTQVIRTEAVQLKSGTRRVIGQCRVIARAARNVQRQPAVARGTAGNRGDVARNGQQAEPEQSNTLDQKSVHECNKSTDQWKGVQQCTVLNSLAEKVSKSTIQCDERIMRTGAVLKSGVQATLILSMPQQQQPQGTIG